MHAICHGCGEEEKFVIDRSFAFHQVVLGSGFASNIFEVVVGAWLELYHCMQLDQGDASCMSMGTINV